jgi:hypothetical protein
MSFSNKSITQTGSIARACLTPGQRGKVLAAFSKAIYLLTDAGELFWLTSENAPLHQRCAQFAPPLVELSAGSPFHVDYHRLIINSGFIVEIDNASLWNAPRLDPNHVLELSQVPARLRVFFSQLDFSESAGFGIFIPHILALSQDESVNPVSAFADPILHYAHPVVLDMARACLNQQPFLISKNAEALIGLGVGLTPSGDDFLGGLLFAMQILQAAYPDLSFIKHSIPIETYHSRTHLISFVLLKDLANGQAIAPVHHIVNGLLSGKSFDNLDPFISQLAQIGHSTGWDLLAGLVTGLLMTHTNREVPDQTFCSI